MRSIGLSCLLLSLTATASATRIAVDECSKARQQGAELVAGLYTLYDPSDGVGRRITRAKLNRLIPLADSVRVCLSGRIAIDVVRLIANLEETRRLLPVPTDTGTGRVPAAAVPPQVDDSLLVLVVVNRIVGEAKDSISRVAQAVAEAVDSLRVQLRVQQIQFLAIDNLPIRKTLEEGLAATPKGAMVVGAYEGTVLHVGGLARIADRLGRPGLYFGGAMILDCQSGCGVVGGSAWFSQRTRDIEVMLGVSIDEKVGLEAGITPQWLAPLSVGARFSTRRGLGVSLGFTFKDIPFRPRRGAKS